MINKLIDSTQLLGRAALARLQALGRAGVFLFSSLMWGGPGSAGFGDLIKQIYSIGVRSLSIIIVAGFFVGMVLGLQGYTILSDFGSEAALGTMVSLTLLRELGPVVTALLFAGRAGFIAMPILALLFSLVGIWGGAYVGINMLGVDEGAYWGNMQASVQFYDDVIKGLIKSLAFGLVVTWIAVYQGFDSIPTSEGISKATTQTVVVASLAVLGLDFVLTAIMLGSI